MKSIAILGLAAMLALPAQAADPLPAFHGDSRQSSVSGLSSGAFMAAQYQVAFSASVVGAGVVAGGPYYCAQGSLAGTAACMAGPPPQPSLLLAGAKQFAAAGQIDPLADLAKRRIYLFSGTQDSTVRTPVVDAAASFFQLAGVPAAQLAYQKQLPAGHAQITPSFGNNCGATASPYLNHCTWQGQGYDQAGLILKHIYGALQPKPQTTSGKLLSFDQTPYAAAGSSLAAEGYVYVPRACFAGQACKVHIALHGCQQYAGKVGDAFYAHAGYNEWADDNRIIVLYPQTTTSAANPQGCWDWFGYTGPAYAWKTGLQMRALKAMADRLVSAP
ncbi:extracellular catalytic domain type 2 short-chain-length polyhydroxyalkanoate depolymerase [Chromobacterium violaceum]|uniref:extracellular catalytic domain type 2 short-chain-length polyhydroxyalkanoate depolymerase n=1 Tax=Chromobacterium violaceum TaxID=536 RepID=UPI001C8CAA98|nr:PHB depolymerase family esterase [Chromobacterium violaceum]MBX9266123.1 PHB depolymerase family esterase [Chromobacterium violaceum]